MSTRFKIKTQYFILLLVSIGIILLLLFIIYATPIRQIVMTYCRSEVIYSPTVLPHGRRKAHDTQAIQAYAYTYYRATFLPRKNIENLN